MGHGKSKHKKANKGPGMAKRIFGGLGDAVAKVAPIIGAAAAPIFGPETLAIGGALGGLGGVLGQLNDMPGEGSGSQGGSSTPGGLNMRNITAAGANQLQRLQVQNPTANRFIQAAAGSSLGQSLKQKATEYGKGKFQELQSRKRNFEETNPMASKFIRTNLGRARQTFKNKDIVRHSSNYLSSHTDKGLLVQHQFKKLF